MFKENDDALRNKEMAVCIKIKEWRIKKEKVMASFSFSANWRKNVKKKKSESRK